MNDFDEQQRGPAFPFLTSKFWQSLAGRILRVPLAILVLLYVLFDDLILSWLMPAFDWFGRRRIFIRLTLWIRRLGPYPALCLFAVPFILLEPFKIGGLVLVGTGRLVSGGIMLAVAHLLSLLIVERLFHVTRDQLLTIGWFAWGFRISMALKDWAFGLLRRSPVWRAGRQFGHWLNPLVRTLERYGASVADLAIRLWRQLAARSR